MASEIWGLLGIAPTTDKKAIRSAYAAQSRLHHPEEEPEYFVRLNQAYRQALGFAQTGGGGNVGAGNEEEKESAERNRRKVVRKRESAAEMDGSGKEEGKREFVVGTDESGEDESKQESVAETNGSGEYREVVRKRVSAVEADHSGEDGRKPESATETTGFPKEVLDKETAQTDAGEGEASLLERLAGAWQKAIQESMETGALHDFITLFTNAKQAKVADTWRRFFLTEAFLREQYTEDFARGLYTYLMGQEVFPWDNLPMGLLQELAIAYALVPHFAGEEYGEGMKYPKEWYKVSVEQTFPARKQVAEIFNRQGWECDLKSMTRRMLKQPANKVRHNAFSDYLNLKEMGRGGQLTEAEKETWQHILGLGQVHYLYERNGKRLGSGDYESRSECVVKLYVQWLKEERLPECVLKFLYQKFAFRELDRSSTRGLYGALKEQVLIQLPQTEELLFGQDGVEQKVTKVYRICSRIINDNQNNYEKSIYEETPKIREQVEALLAMPEWRELSGSRGLFDKLYGGAKRLVMPRSLAEGLILYLEQGDYPEPKRTELLESLLRSLSTSQMCREIDYHFRMSFSPVDMDRLEENRDFWQYYLMRGYGFRHSRIRGNWEEGYLYEMNGECYLPAYIRYLYAPSKVWQKAFTGFCEETESISNPVSAVCALPDGRLLRVEFHFHYCLYFVEEVPVLSPVLSFAELRRWAEGYSRAQDFFFLLAVTAIEPSERKEAEEFILQCLGRLPLYPHIRSLVARMLAADNDRLPVGTKAVYYEEQERFCFRAVVSSEGIRIYRQMEFGWEDRIFRRAEFGWKEVPPPMEFLCGQDVCGEGCWKEVCRQESQGKEIFPQDAELEEGVRGILRLLRQPKPVRLAVENLEGMDPLQKAQAVLRNMEFPENPEGYCVLRYGKDKERRHDKVFYGALWPFGFPIGAHSTEYERTLHFHMDVSRTKIKEGKCYVGRFGWGFKYSHLSDYGPVCVYQGDSGTYYADGAIKMYRAESLDKLLADYLGQELEGVTEVETYGGLLTISRLDHRLEYCYGEADLEASFRGQGQTMVDFHTIFGGYRLWEAFARWMDAALEKGLPDWVNVLTIGQNLGNREGEGSLLSLTASHVEEVNLDLLEWQERLMEEDSQREDGKEKPAGEEEDQKQRDEEEKKQEGQKREGQKQQEEEGQDVYQEWECPQEQGVQRGLQKEGTSGYEEYPLEAPYFVWGKGLTVQAGRQTLKDVVQWYLEEGSGEGAKLLKSLQIRVEITDQVTV